MIIQFFSQEVFMVKTIDFRQLGDFTCLMNEMFRYVAIQNLAQGHFIRVTMHESRFMHGRGKNNSTVGIPLMKHLRRWAINSTLQRK